MTEKLNQSRNFRRRKADHRRRDADFTGKGNTRKREVADGRCEGEDPGEAAGIG